MSNMMANIGNVTVDPASLHTANEIAKQKTEKDEFLKLFVAQLRNQNPLEPQDGADFLGQLAQFSTVEGIKNMESAFNKIADSLNSTQALQATALVGKKVQVNTDLGLYDNEKITGSIEVPPGVHEVAMNIYDTAGQLIKSYQLSTAGKNEVNFTWDGLNESGDPANKGIYRFEAQGHVGGQSKSFNTFIAANVDSVTINKNGEGMTLNVAGFGKVSIKDIKAIS